MKVPSPTRFGPIRTTAIPVILSLTAAAMLPNPALAQADLETPEGLIEEIYRLVTFPAGTTPDWDAVRSLFIPEALVVLRTSREGSTVFSVDGFVQDFVAFIEQADVEQTGFTERILDMQTFEWGDIAHALVLFDSDIPGDGREPRAGVDSFQLIKRDGRWWIASISNERPSADLQLPEVFGP
ncbi:MAG: hypothetical protein JJE01_09730 [Gemmatimonadetes bacterium]|nr:hypothetical protein [Gemmatimonadota bacterium]